MTEQRKAIVAGAGVGGLTAGIALQRAGWQVTVFEAAQTLRTGGTGLSIMANAMAALNSIGAHAPVEQAGQEIRQFFFKKTGGAPITSIPIHEIGEQLGYPSMSIQRPLLLRALAQQLAPDTLITGMRCAGYTNHAHGVTVHFEDGSSQAADLLIGADGLNSVIRRQMLGETPLRSSGYIAWLAVTPFSHPVMTEGYVAHYWGRGKRFGLCDVGDGHAYWWGTCNHENASHDALSLNKQEVLDAYAGWAPEVCAAIEATPDDVILKMHARDRQPVEQFCDGHVALLGDAAHPMLPSLGQGAAQAIEDAVVLADRLAKTPDLRTALAEYEAHRHPRANEIVNTARFMSGIEQAESSIACWLRDWYMRLAPKSSVRKKNIDIMSFKPCA
ncbi:FAD-dependent monooxygenase [Pseudomonas sp. RHF3.3-3]|uniref:2-polyprenyl-6-methoxyphenol hydroxylase-like oxidoreductase n=1 Tax=Pseudomonas asplenii TaxID=53407 RepID=A0A0M9GFD9_9PSED|nr:FAD-dependent monooxygenase [Pseudomonas fuscovaginae]KPA89804.1 2-polyprenyl-6-methoxyphenol hydroxylase-like oxidoreductase [Pseudomonas fuscovaginae]